MPESQGEQLHPPPLEGTAYPAEAVPSGPRLARSLGSAAGWARKTLGLNHWQRPRTWTLTQRHLRPVMPAAWGERLRGAARPCG